MDQKNLVIAIVLSVAILIGFQFIFQWYQPAKPPPAPGHAAPNRPVPAARAPGIAGSGTAMPGATNPAGVPPSMEGTAGSAGRAEILAHTKRVKIDTPSLHGSISLKGARLDDLTLADYHETANPKSPEVVLLEPSGTAQPYFAEFGWVADTKGAKVPGADTEWTAAGGPLTPKSPVTLTWDNGEGLQFTRTISVDEHYMFTVRQAVRNTGKAAVRLNPYGLINRTGTPQVSGYYILFEGLIGELDGSLQQVKYTALPTQPRPCPPGSKDIPYCYTGTSGWLGFTDKYWLTSLIPPLSEKGTAQFTRFDDKGVDRYQSDFLGPTVNIPAAGTADSSMRFFAGAKRVNLLDAYAASGIPHFDLAIDFGWFYFLTKPIFLTLVFFKGLLGNFGLAILLLTFLFKLVFFPLANKSYKSMSKMKLLQPEMQKIRERFPDDKARQQQEIMAMYKRVGANPVAGCLPIVIQIPVFFSLYKVLFVTIEMRHAPFYGWIHDLSAPDPTSFANLFGLIPFTPPHFLMIGAWPIIMGITMFLQQKLNPQPVDPVQARMFMVLPVVFTYMLSAFPAGLVIYWAWNNLLSIAQQWAIMHRAGAA